MWSGEHSSSTTRLLAETEIFLRWMDLQDEDIWARYQAYGEGKRKLMRIHMADLASKSPAVEEVVAETLAKLQAKTGGEHGEWLTEVNLESSFSGKTVRQMAEECGAADLYRYLYQSASGVSHGEWWAVEDYGMQRCMNPLHRFHRIPSFYAITPTAIGFGRALTARVCEVIDLAESLLVRTESEGDDA